MNEPQSDTSGFETFDEQERHRLLEEDRVAWRHVCGELMAIVLVGLVLAMITVSICAG